jgi:thiol-disulfide isomerase/thioredoxin
MMSLRMVFRTGEVPVKPLRIRKTTVVILGAGILLIAGTLAAREYFKRQALSAVLSSDAPTDAAMNAYVAAAKDPAAALNDLWTTRRIPHRLFVLSYIRDHARTDPALWQRLRPFVLESITFADAEMQGDALARLAEHQDPELPAAALRCLQSPDPESRQLALLQMSPLKNPQFAAAYIALLDDPERPIRVLAAGGVRNLTGLDFGIRMSATPEVLDAGIAQWKAWWTTAQHNFPTPAASASAAESPAGSTYPFALPDLAGKTVRLSDYAGKVVVLNFWATWCAPCVAEMPALQDLQSRHPNDVVILGINVNNAQDDDDDGPPATGTPADAERTVRAFVKEQKLSFPILLDAHSDTIGPYGASSLPTSVIIGPDGQIRRRIIGPRTPTAWDAMIAEAAGKPRQAIAPAPPALVHQGKTGE